MIIYYIEVYLTMERIPTIELINHPSPHRFALLFLVG